MAFLSAAHAWYGNWRYSKAGQYLRLPLQHWTDELPL